MPEDYQAILGDLGVDVSNDTTETPVNPPDTANDDTSNNVPNQDTNTQDVQTDSSNGDQPNEVINLDDQKRNEAFAAMRAENTKYKKFMQQIMRGAGYSGAEEDFMNQFVEASYRRQAQREGSQVSPEILKRMDQLENQNQALLDNQNRNIFAANIKNLQETFKLSDADLKEFLNLAVQEKIDLTIPGTNFVTLYQGLFFDKLKDKLIEEERQKWITQNNKANSATNPDGKSGKKDPTPTDVNTMAEFDSLLQSIPKK